MTRCSTCEGYGTIVNPNYNETAYMILAAKMDAKVHQQRGAYAEWPASVKERLITLEREIDALAQYIICPTCQGSGDAEWVANGGEYWIPKEE